MSPDKQRIAIAKTCGYTQGVGMNGLEWWTNSEGVHDEPPDYTNDLNAMHAAEKTISGPDFETELWTHYLINLGKVVNKRRAHATAAQRAEAFLRTLNLWKP